jgi:hypothetical protein
VTVTDLLLHEQRVDAVLDEMADIGMTQTMRAQLAREDVPLIVELGG